MKQLKKGETNIKTKPLTECLCLPGGPFGYNEVAMIPAGATHIRVTDNSRNYLGKIQPVTKHTGHLVIHFASLAPWLERKSWTLN